MPEGRVTFRDYVMRRLAASHPGQDPDEQFLLSLLEMHERLMQEFDRLEERLKLRSRHKLANSP